VTDPSPLQSVPDAASIENARDGSPIDIEKIERAVREILEAIGEDPDRDGLVRTPARIAHMYEEIFAGHLRGQPRRDGDGARHRGDERV
jgi:GTP cyclohydrolase I